MAHNNNSHNRRPSTEVQEVYTLSIMYNRAEIITSMYSFIYWSNLLDILAYIDHYDLTIKKAVIGQWQIVN